MLLARGGCSPTLGWVGLHISKMLKTRRRCSHKMHSRLMIIFSVDARCAKLPGRVDGAKRCPGELHRLGVFDLPKGR